MEANEARIFWGLAFQDQDKVPWTPKDNKEQFPDQWPIRYKNQSGKAPPSTCRVATYGRLANFYYCYASIHESEQSGTTRAVSDIDFPEVPEHWSSQLREFCEVLEIPWSEPDWHLVVLQHI